MMEQQKYQTLWEKSAYRQFSPGEMICIDDFIKLAKPSQNDTITDYGCGTGRAALRLSAYANIRMIDFADNCLDERVIAERSHPVSC